MRRMPATLDPLELAQGRETDAAVIVDRTLECRVAGFVARDREVDVDQHDRAAGRADLVDGRGQDRTRPGPVLERAQAAGVDGHHGGLGRERAQLPMAARISATP